MPSIQGPDKEWLTAPEAAAWLGIGRKSFVILAKELQVHPSKLGHRSLMWNWRDVIGMSIVLTWKRHPMTDEEAAS